MGLELQMTTDLQHDLPAEIGFNFKELKSELKRNLEYYNQLQVTEGTIKQAKEDRASLNKLKGALNKRRLDVKKAYLKPYDEFEGKIKELTLLIDEPIKAIDTQLDVYEQKRREEKADQIFAAYDEIIPDNLKEIIPLIRIQDTKWLNKGTAMKKVREDLEAWNTRVNADLLALDTIEDQYKAAVKQKYIETLDVSRAIAHRDQLKAAEEAFRAREEERKAREAAREMALKQPQEAAVKVEEVNTQVVEENRSETQETTYTQLYKLTLQFQLTRDQAIALRMFLDQNKISYRKL